jgi:tetratricopeptide (TPR) repeat protein
VSEGRVEAGFQAMAAGDWPGARDAFSAALAAAELPEAFFGLATALFWLGDLAGTIANCEKAYAGFRRRPDPMFAAGAPLALVARVLSKLGLRRRAEAAAFLARGAPENRRGEPARYR